MVTITIQSVMLNAPFVTGCVVSPSTSTTLDVTLNVSLSSNETGVNIYVFFNLHTPNGAAYYYARQGNMITVVGSQTFIVSLTKTDGFDATINGNYSIDQVTILNDQKNYTYTSRTNADNCTYFQVNSNPAPVCTGSNQISNVAGVGTNLILYVCCDSCGGVFKLLDSVGNTVYTENAASGSCKNINVPMANLQNGAYKAMLYTVDGQPLYEYDFNLVKTYQCIAQGSGASSCTQRACLSGGKNCFTTPNCDGVDCSTLGGTWACDPNTCPDDGSNWCMSGTCIKKIYAFGVAALLIFSMMER